MIVKLSELLGVADRKEFSGKVHKSGNEEHQPSAPATASEAKHQPKESENSMSKKKRVSKQIQKEVENKIHKDSISSKPA